MGWAIYYQLQDEAAEILRCTGDGAPLTLPRSIEGRPVTAICADCFAQGSCPEGEGFFPVPGHALPPVEPTPGSLQRLTLPEGIQSIGERAFARCSGLKHLALPPGLRRLGQRVFEGSGLEQIALPAALEALPDYAFAQCRQLRRITLPPALRSLGGHCFYNCRTLEDVVLPDGAGFVGEGLFMNCEALSRLSVPSGINLSVVLSDLQNPLELTVRFPDGLARFFLPGFSYEYESVTAPRVWRTITYGAGQLYRECFSSRDIDFDLYEDYFETALLQDDVADTVRIALFRLRWPYRLNRGRQRYLAHLSAHMETALEQLMDGDDREGLEVLLSLTSPDRETLGALADCAQRRNKVFFASRLMEERMRLSPGAEREFEL